MRYILPMLLLLSATPEAAASPPPPVSLREVASGLSLPLEIAHAGDGSGRLFIVEQGGAIRIVSNGAVLPAPFLDISSRVLAGPERGLLGVAFHPQYASNRRFFVFYTRVPDGALQLSSFVASAANGDVADPASELSVFTIPHPAEHHNGGRIAFGPDGYLYASLGDGDSAPDVNMTAQDLTSLLGKVLRLDVSGTAGYSIPPDNPVYAGTPGARREIWAYGLRNPWKFSFDRGTGDLYIGDVGQRAREEVDHMPQGSAGLNFGWPVFEGSACFSPPSGCTLASHTPPILEYGRELGNAVTGGYVYRGARSEALRGYYVYGDVYSNRVWAARRQAGTWTSFVLIEPPSVLGGATSFGEDENGELYVTSFADGRIYALEAAPAAAAIVNPPDGSQLAGPSQLFQWNATPGASLYQLWIGNSAGAHDLGYFPEAGTTSTSTLVSGMPTDGRTLHARLWSLIDGTYRFRDHVLTASPGGAVITSPAAGSSLAGATQVFQWNDVGASLYQLWVGNAPGTYDIGFFPASGTAATSTTASPLPVDGRTLHLRLWSAIGGTYVFRDFTYQAALPEPASMIFPTLHLATPEQEFRWTAAPGADLYQLWLGSARGAFDYGYFPPAGTTSTSTIVGGMPGDGRLVFATLWSLMGGTYRASDHVYTAATRGSILASPVPGSTLGGSMQEFAWPGVPGATLYQLWVGSTEGAHDLGFFPASGTTSNSTVATGLPTDGRRLYVRLWTLAGGVYHKADYLYTAAP